MKQLSFIISFLGVSLSSLIFFLEAFFYTGFVQKYLHISTSTPAILTLIAIVLMRVVWKQSVNHRTQKILTILAPLSVYIYMILLWSDRILFANFSFSTFHLHPAELMPLVVFLSLVTILTWTRSFLQSNANLIRFLAPIWATPLMYIFSQYSEHGFWYMEKEDSITEWLTFFVYLGAAFFSARLAHLFQKQSKNRHQIQRALFLLYAVATIGFLLVAGEEISWGQRLIGFQTPTEISVNNTQQEFNIHNNVFVFQFVYIGYGLLATYCACSWIGRKFVEGQISKNANKYIYLFSPPPLLIGYFIPMIIYVIIRGIYGDKLLDRWEEYFEILLAIGITIFLHINLKRTEILKR